VFAHIAYDILPQHGHAPAVAHYYYHHFPNWPKNYFETWIQKGFADYASIYALSVSVYQ